jgi:hypothetical protein
MDFWVPQKQEISLLAQQLLTSPWRSLPCTPITHLLPKVMGLIYWRGFNTVSVNVSQFSSLPVRSEKDHERLHNQ